MAGNKPPIDLEWERDKDKAAISKAVVLSDEEKEASYRRIDEDYENRKRFEELQAKREEKETDQAARYHALNNQTEADSEAMASTLAQIHREKIETIRAAENQQREEHKNISTTDNNLTAPPSSPSLALHLKGEADEFATEFIEDPIDNQEINDDSLSVTINENLVSNQAFKQSISNLVTTIEKTKRVTIENNLLSVTNKDLQTESIQFFDKFESELNQIIEQIDTSTEPLPANQDRQIKNWFDNNWPEAVEKFNEFANKKALADIFVTTGLVGAFGLAGLTIGVVFSIPPAVSFGAGTFFGMWATRQVSSKEAVKRVEDHLEEKDEDS